jgi:adhesin/invasin
MENKISHSAAWLCIFSQLLPALSWAVPTNPQLPTKEQHSISLNTTSKTYTLTDGDTIETVAKRFNFSVSDLKKYNQLRTFSKSFEKLGPGDEIDVPIDNKHQNVFSATPQKTSNKENELFWANSASTGASILNAEDSQLAAANMAKNIASQAASQSLAEWFSGFGTARINLGLNEHYRPDGSAIDLLMPIYEIEKSFIFTQLGLRNKDSRTTLNMGLGARYFTDAKWMFGGNVFLDNEFTGKNKRLGIGAEAWTDYFKLSSNSYHPITEWHQSRDFSDYDERPARGYDLRAEAYIPYYPQLGGKLFYEKYFGDEVALSGKNKRQKDPYGLVAGLSYTPFPLLTTSIEQRMGNSHDTQFMLGLNYKFGMPLKEQLSSESVDKVRTLAGSKRDLIERNNNIVLEYKKQDIINLKFQHPTINGNAGEKIKVQPTVKAKYGLKKIEWDALELIAAGGKLETLNTNTLLVTLPTKNPLLRSALVSQYTLGAIAYDNKGNRTNRTTTDIIVSDPAVQLDSSNLSITYDKAIANGVDSNTVRAVITDATGDKVSGVVVSFSADDKRVTVVTPSVTSDANGVAETQLTSIAAGSFPITATIVTGGKEVSKSVDANFIADAASAKLTDFRLASQNNVFADGEKTIELQAKVVDSNGNPVANQNVDFKSEIVSGVMLDPKVATTDSNGIANTRISSTQIATILVTATVKNSSSESSQKTVDTTFIDSNSPPDVKNSKLYAEPTSIMASTATPSLITLELKDKYGNSLENRTVDFTSDQNSTTTFSEVLKNGGIYTSLLTSTTPGDVIVSAKVNGQHFDIGTTKVIVTAGLPSFNRSNFNITKPTIIANDVDFTTATLQLFDANDNKVENVKNIVFKTSGQVGERELNAVETSPGVYTVNLKGTKAGDAFVKASVPGLETFESVGFKLIANRATVKGDLKAQSPKILASQTNIISLELYDSNGNQLKGLADNIQFYAADANGNEIKEGISFTGVSGGQNDGKYKAIVSGNRAQVLYIRAKLDGVEINTPECVVTIIPAEIDELNSTLIATETLVVNQNGELNLDLKDKFGNKITLDNGESVTFVVDSEEPISARKNDQGDYIATFNAGKKARSATIFAQVSKKTVKTKTVTITADVSRVKAEAVLSKNEIIADGDDYSILTITLRDEDDNVVEAIPNFVDSDTSSDILKSDFVHNGNGVYTSQIKGIKGRASRTAKPISVQFGGEKPAVKSITLIADTSSLDSAQSTLEIESNPITAGNTTKLVLKIKDITGNPASDEMVEFRTIANGSCAAERTQFDGEYECSLQGKVAGTETVSTFISSAKFNVSAKTLIIQPSEPNKGKSTLIARDSVIFDTGSTVFTLTLRDAYDNPVMPEDLKGITNFKELFASDSVSTKFADANHQGLGVYTVTFSDKNIATPITVKGQYMNEDLSEGVQVRVVPNSDINTVASDITLTPSVGFAGSSKFTARLNLFNSVQNIINDAKVSFKISIDNMEPLIKEAENLKDGIYSVSITPDEIKNKSGLLTVTALAANNEGTLVSIKTKTAVINADISTATATSELTNKSIIANDTDTSILTVKIKDANGNPITGEKLNFIQKPSSNVTTTPFVDNNDGTYTSVVTGKSGKASEKPQELSISSDNNIVVNNNIILVADTNHLDSYKSTVAANPKSITAGKSPTVLSTTIKDNLGNPANNESVVFNTDANGYCVGKRTDNEGEYSCELTGYKALKEKASVFISNKYFGIYDEFTITADRTTPTAGNSTLTIDKNVVFANGGTDTGTATLRLTLRDTYGNNLSGMPVVFSSANAADGTVNIVTTDNNDGTYTAKISGNTVQDITIQVSVTGYETFITKEEKLSFTADSSNLSESKSIFTITPQTITAGTDANKGAVVTLVLYDIYGNKVKGDSTIQFNSLQLGTSFPAVMDIEGNYSAQIVSTIAGTDTITAIVKGTSFKQGNLVVTADVSKISLLSTIGMTKNNIPADGVSQNTIQLKLLDMYKNPVTGKTVIFNTPDSTVSISNVTSDNNGVYSASVTGNIPGSYNLTATVAENPSYSANTTAVFTAPPMPTGTTLYAGGVLFGLGSQFPSTAFQGATFQIRLGGVESNNQNFNWDSSATSVASVDQTGKVKILTKPDTNTPVLITAKNKSSGVTYTYTIPSTLKFFTAYPGIYSWSAAANFCKSQGKLQPTQAMLTSGAYSRLFGSLFGEWGNLTVYTGSGFSAASVWSSSSNSSGNHSYVSPVTGLPSIDGDATAGAPPVCYI